MFSRHLAPVLRAAAGSLPVVTLVGPRQSGKTTLARATFPDHAYVSLEQPDERRFATDDARGFLARFRGRGVVLDEVQRAPDLLSYIQGIVDDDGTPGRFVLTGSQNLLLMQSVSQSLAGRTAVLRLLPLSLSELLGRPPLDPEALEQVPADVAPPSRSLWELVYTGLYPRVHDRGIDPARWYADYHRTYVDRDLREVLRVMDLDAFERFLHAAAASTGQELVLASLAADVGISLNTAKSWLGALSVGFIVTTLPTHHASFRKRLRKHPKLHFLDTGLACHLLGIRSAEVLASHPLRGALFESFIVAELRKAFEHAGRDAPLFFWRDASKREVDLLVDLGTRVVPIEIKSGLTVAPDAFESLRYWTSLQGNPNRGGLLVHGGDRAFSHGDVTVRPWFLA